MYGKVKKQFEHAKSIKDDISKFNSLWISFNCFYNIKIEKGNDRQKIDKIKNDTNIKEIFLLLEEKYKNDFFKFINNRTNKGIKNLRYKNIIKYLDINSFSEFLEIIYMIRNNQFHGGKDWESESDIFLLIETNLIFEIFLEKLYKKYNIIN